MINHYAYRSVAKSSGFIVRLVPAQYLASKYFDILETHWTEREVSDRACGKKEGKWRDDHPSQASQRENDDHPSKAS